MHVRLREVQRCKQPRPPPLTGQPRQPQAATIASCSALRATTPPPSSKRYVSTRGNQDFNRLERRASGGHRGRDGPRSRVYVPETRAYHSYKVQQKTRANGSRSTVSPPQSPVLTALWTIHTSFAHSTAFTAHTRHGFTHRDTESVPHTEQTRSGPSTTPPG